MKSLFRTLILHILILLARRRLHSSSAVIIGITGSVGKTTCKEAAAHILSGECSIFTSLKSYNTEFGLPLTLLEEESPGSHPLKWIPVLLRSARRAFFIPITAEYIVLEYGVDKPGDMDLLLSICTPDIAVLTKIAPVHLAEGQFSSEEDIFKEKIKLLEAVGTLDNTLILWNRDDPFQTQWASTYQPKGEIQSFSAKEDICNVETSVKGISATFFPNTDHSITVTIPILGKWHLETLLPAISIAQNGHILPETLKRQLSRFRLPPGRLSLLEGKKNTWIIDSTYNASPKAVEEALTVLSEIPGKRKIFVFGNMNELGSSSIALHKDLAPHIAKHSQLVIGVGEGPKHALEALRTMGYTQEQLVPCTTVFEAIDWYKKHIQPEDVLLVKGSQNNVRLEHFVKAFMKNPEHAKQLLVRQSEQWTKTS